MVFVFNSNPVNRNTVLIQFSGLNSCHFYRLLKTQEFNWEIFEFLRFKPRTVRYKLYSIESENSEVRSFTFLAKIRRQI